MAPGVTNFGNGSTVDATDYTTRRLCKFVSKFFRFCSGVNDERMASAKEFTDYLACHICKELYMDPRVLPCGHTFCFNCINQCRGNRQPGQSMPCPLCRQQVTTLPSQLPKNYSVTNILEKIKELGSAVNCDQHVDRKIELYCTDCKVAICMMCFITSHNGHKYSDINSYCENIRKQMTNDVAKVTSRMNKCSKMLRRVEKEKKDFIERFEKAGLEVDKKAEQLKQMIDDHRKKLRNELEAKKQARMKDIESSHEKIQRQLLSMESYKKDVDELSEKGTAYDIARAARGLHNRVDELLKFDVIERTLADLGHADVTFTSSNYVTDDVEKTLGRLHLNVSKTGELVCFLETVCINSFPECHVVRRMLTRSEITGPLRPRWRSKSARRKPRPRSDLRPVAVLGRGRRSCSPPPQIRV